jgi:hypothetical protein
MVGRLTLDERRARVERYRDKKKRRLLGKVLRYRVRRVIADRRMRVKGRFISREVETSLVLARNKT